jgi:hypothetical protein
VEIGRVSMIREVFTAAHTANPSAVLLLNDFDLGTEYEILIDEMYTILSSHPLVEAITTWDAVDGKWLKAPSGLLCEDNSVKPVFTELEKRINGEWKTETEIVTNISGEAVFEGF